MLDVFKQVFCNVRYSLIAVVIAFFVFVHGGLFLYFA